MAIQGFGWKEYRLVQRMRKAGVSIDEIAAVFEHRFTLDEITQGRKEFAGRRLAYLPEPGALGARFEGRQIIVSDDKFAEAKHRRALFAKRSPTEEFLGTPPAELSALADMGGTFDWKPYERRERVSPLSACVLDPR